MKAILVMYGLSALLALTAAPPISELSNITATAILGWYAWHTSTRTVPGLITEFRQDLANQRAGQRAERDAFLLEIAEQRMERKANQ